VRELEHTILRAALRAAEGRREDIVVIEASHLGLEPVAARETSPAPPTGRPLRASVDTFTRDLITSTLAACDDNWAEAARRLGLQRGNLHRLAARLGMQR